MKIRAMNLVKLFTQQTYT